MARNVALPIVKIEKSRKSRAASLNSLSQDERERVLGALQKAGLLAEPPSEMRRAARRYEARYSPAERERLLAELRRLRLKPSLSATILQNRK